MVNNSEKVSNGPTPAEISEWDTLMEGSVEQLDEKEATLKNELTQEYKFVTLKTKVAYEEISRILDVYDIKKSERALDALENFVENKGTYDDDVYDSLFDLVDEYYPSAKSDKVRNPEAMNEKERRYLDANTRNGRYSSAVLDEIVNNFVIDDPDNDIKAATYIDDISESTSKQSEAFPAALVQYLKDPTKENEEVLDRLNDNYIDSITYNVYDVASYFDQSGSRAKASLVDPLVGFMSSTAYERGALYVKLKEYLAFKMDNSREEYRPKTETEEKTFDALPDDVIS